MNETYIVKRGDTFFMGNNGYKLYELSYLKRNNYDIMYSILWHIFLIKNVP